jgi:hypothetical protein
VVAREVPELAQKLVLTRQTNPYLAFRTAARGMGAPRPVACMRGLDSFGARWPPCGSQAEQEPGHHEIKSDAQQRVPRWHKGRRPVQVEPDVPPDVGHPPQGQPPQRRPQTQPGESPKHSEPDLESKPAAIRSGGECQHNVDERSHDQAESQQQYLAAAFPSTRYEGEQPAEYRPKDDRE